MNRFLIAVLLCACGVFEPRVDLKVETQIAVDNLSAAMLNRDVVGLAKVFAPTALAEFEAYSAERDAKLLSFIEQQEEGFVMAYGREAPKVVSVEVEEYGALLVELRAPAGEKAFDERVRLKKVHFWRSDEGRVYFVGLAPAAHETPVGVARQGLLKQVANFDVANNSSIIHFWRHSWKTPSPTDCTGCSTLGNGVPCPQVNTPNGFFGVQPFQAVGFSENANCGGPGSCAVRQATPVNAGCSCDGAGGAQNGVACFGSSCCFQSAFSSDFWWNNGDNNAASLGFCHTGTCPN